MTPRRRYVSQCSAPIVFLLKDKNSDQQAPDEANQECHYLAGLLELDICGLASWLSSMRDQSTSSRFPKNLAEFVRFCRPASLMASLWLHSGPFKSCF